MVDNMSVSRRHLLGDIGIGFASLAMSGYVRALRIQNSARIALQLYSIREYIGGGAGANGNAVSKGVGLERALEDIAAIGFSGVEFAGYYHFTPQRLKKALSAAGIRPCGTHVGNDRYGINVSRNNLNVDVLKRTCDFELSYGNTLVICPGGGNIPPGCQWSVGVGGTIGKSSQEIDDFTKKLCELYNKAAEEAKKMGCRIGIHNHAWEHGVRMRNGMSFWDYFLSNTSKDICMEQDVGWSTCADVDPRLFYRKYPGRSPTLHAKENGVGEHVLRFDGILGEPGVPGAKPVDWDGLIPVTERDGVQWYVVECERHAGDLSAVMQSFKFLKSKGLQ